MKNSFVMYTDYLEQTRMLSDEQMGILFRAILQYVSTGEILDMDNLTEMAFTFIKVKLDRDAEKYAATVEKRREAGRLGGLAGTKQNKQKQANQANASFAKQNKQKQANQADNDNDNDNENDNDINIISCPEPLISLVLNTGEEYPFYQKDIDGFAALYPAVDIMQEMRKMKGWCENNPANRKTSRGIRRFVNSWLAKEQDRAKKPQPTAKPNSFNNFNQREQDYEALQTALLKKSMNGDHQ